MTIKHRAKYRVLQGLGVEGFKEVCNDLERGLSVPSIQRMLHKRGECEDLKPMALQKALYRLRDDLKAETQIVPLDSRHAQDQETAEESEVDPVEAQFRQVVREVRGETDPAWQARLHAMDEIETLVHMQQERLNKVHRREKESPLLMQQVSSEMRLQFDMLSTLAKLQLETGAIKRAPKHMTGTVTDADGNVREFSWTEEIDGLLQVIDGEVTDLTVDQ